MVGLDNEEQESEELHIQLRNKFLAELNSDDYEPEDVDRIRNDDHYCKRFILHKKGNFDEAYKMAKEALAWRKSFGVKDCTGESIPPDFFNAKAAFPYNKDKEGNPIILLLIKFHKKNAEFAKDMRRFVIYWVEKMEEESGGGQMTVIMNCADAGLSNLDLDMIKFLITLFRSYYPHSLAHILIFEMPWIFNAAWKIIKSWLPEDFVEKIVFVNKTSIQDFISKENLPVYMNGTCTLEYEPPEFARDVNSNEVTEVSRENDQRRVHFSQNGHAGGDDSELSSPRRRRPKDDTSHLLITDDYCILGEILKISPAQDLIFYPAPKNETAEVTIKLTSVSDKSLTYKVKTNNIESYRVKPSIGIIEPNNSIDISVYLVQGHQPLPSDKFLIMAMELPDDSISMPSLSHLWRTSSPDVMADHKLRCVIGVPESEKRYSKLDTTLQDISTSLSKLEAKVELLEASQRSSARIEKISLAFIICLALSFWTFMLHSTFFTDI